MQLFLKKREDLPHELNRIGFMGMGAEIGVLRGEFSAHILRGWQGRRLYLVDAWRHDPGRYDAHNHEAAEHLENMSAAARAVAPFGDRAVIIRDLSVHTAALFPDGSLDFVYIDGAHDYASVLADLGAWVPKVARGGLVIGDDYADGVWSYTPAAGVPEHTEFGVKRAVDDYVRFHKLELFLSPEEKPQWWFFKE